MLPTERKPCTVARESLAEDLCSLMFGLGGSSVLAGNATDRRDKTFHIPVVVVPLFDSSAILSDVEPISSPQYKEPSQDRDSAGGSDCAADNGTNIIVSVTAVRPCAVRHCLRCTARQRVL